MEDQCRPLVFHNQIRHWPASKWTPANLKDVMGDTNFRFRIGEQSKEEVQYETKCKYVGATVSHFLGWLGKERSKDNPLSEYSSSDWWCYADYKRMGQMFENNDKVLKAVDWSTFGLEGHLGDDSNFWMGSKGSYAVCHYDTYGCNLVAQLYGRKRWVLFPPDQSECLYPTRIPYEESSVFSKVNILQPDVEKHPKFKSSTPYEVTLQPGDVLFIPRHWWHFVENLDTSISVNTWIKLPCDDEERVKEAIVKTLAFDLMPTKDQGKWLNPTEDPTSQRNNLGLLTESLSVISETSAEPDNGFEPPSKKRKPTANASAIEENISRLPGAQPVEATPIDTFLAQHAGDGETVPQASSLSSDLGGFNLSTISCESLGGSQEIRASPTPFAEVTSSDLFDCLVKSDVLDLVREKLRGKFAEK